MDISYKEKLNRLQVRIRAHKLFANFDINDWIAEFVARTRRTSILDLGCGNGNHLGIYLQRAGENGKVAGLDRESTLIDEAQKAYAGATNLDLRVGSMDDPLPWPDGTFDLCFSNFAIYNAADPSATLAELHRVMQPGAELVLIGPTRHNAREIYEYNERLTGVAIDDITLARTDRLQHEILPIVRTTFGEVREELINSFLTFPTGEEFLQYFTSTMVYEETAEKRGVTHDAMLRALLSQKDVVLSKEMLAIIATRH
jgi:ubiquinone/menaquinone biosynthesis C-methylase UbiE